MSDFMKAALGLVAIACAGCAGDGLSPRENYSQNLTSAVYQPPVELPSTQPVEIAAAPLATEQLSVSSPRAIDGPIRVGVAQVGEVAPPQVMLDTFRKHPELFSRVDPLAGNLEDSGSETLNSRDPKTTMASLSVLKIRKTAAEMGLNYLLIYSGTVDHATTSTPLEIFNLTIVGCFVIPSDQIWANGKAAGSLIDVSTGKVVMNVSVDAKGAAFLPTAVAVNAKDAMTEGIRDQLIQKMTQQTIDRLTDGRRVAVADEASRR